jgi:hypothetical protein
MLHNFRGSLQGAHLANPGHIFAVPLEPELEILVRIKTLGIH